MSEWQTVLFTVVFGLGGIFIYLIYLNVKVAGLEKSLKERGE